VTGQCGYEQLFHRHASNPILTAADWPYPAHTVFNAGLAETWETNRAELRFFEPVATWVERLAQAGFKDSGARILQDNDPTDNVLLGFTKEGRALPGSGANDEAASPLSSGRPEAIAAVA